MDGKIYNRLKEFFDSVGIEIEGKDKFEFCGVSYFGKGTYKSNGEEVEVKLKSDGKISYKEGGEWIYIRNKLLKMK